MAEERGAKGGGYDEKTHHDRLDLADRCSFKRNGLSLTRFRRSATLLGTSCSLLRGDYPPPVGMALMIPAHTESGFQDIGRTGGLPPGGKGRGFLATGNTGDR